MILARLLSQLLSAALCGFGFLSMAGRIMRGGFDVAKVTFLGHVFRVPILAWRTLPRALSAAWARAGGGRAGLDAALRVLTEGSAPFGPRAGEPWFYSLLLAFAVSCLAYLALSQMAGRFLRLFANRRTTLHGSSRWATDRELGRRGLLRETGVVLGQTRDARYAKVPVRRPRRRRGEDRGAFEARLSRWTPGQTEDEMRRPGRIVAQSGNNHTLVVGSTRSGKGVSCIIPTEFRWPESLIVLDPKAEGWGISAAERARFSYTFKFQPERPDESIRYNPLLSIRRGRQTVPDIQNLAHILIPDNPNDKDPFWNNEARKLFAAVCGYVVYCEPPERKTFAQVYSVFSNSEALAEADDGDGDLSNVKRYLKAYVARAEGYIRSRTLPEPLARARSAGRLDGRGREEALSYLDDDDVVALTRFKNDLDYFSGQDDKTLSSVVSTMMSQLTVLADPNVQEVTSRSDFTMEDFLDGVPDGRGGTRRSPLSLYLCVSLSSMGRLAPLLKIFYEQAITLLTRELRKRRFRLLMVFDEFYQMGRMDVVEKALSLSAGYGVLCMVAIQSFDQLRKLYQSEATFIDNFAYQVILRVNDEATSEKIERILGKTTVRHTDVNFSGNADLLHHRDESLHVSQMGRSLMTSAEIRAMDDNDLIIVASGEHPYKARKVRYYLDERFIPLFKDRRGRALPPPPLDGNLPHPEVLRPDGTNPGLDSEGWRFLLGAVPGAQASPAAGVAPGAPEAPERPEEGWLPDSPREDTDDGGLCPLADLFRRNLDDGGAGGAACR